MTIELEAGEELPLALRCLNPCSNGMTIEFDSYEKFRIRCEVLILVLME